MSNINFAQSLRSRFALTFVPQGHFLRALTLTLIFMPKLHSPRITAQNRKMPKLHSPRITAQNRKKSVAIRRRRLRAYSCGCFLQTYSFFPFLTLCACTVCSYSFFITVFALRKLALTIYYSSFTIYFSPCENLPQLFTIHH